MWVSNQHWWVASLCPRLALAPSPPADSCPSLGHTLLLVLAHQFHPLPDTFPVYSFSSIVTPSDVNYKATPLKSLPWPQTR